MSSSVEKIKERISIVDVISLYIKIEQSGKNFKARCPFHNEKTPSFFISPDRGTYYCFGCGEKGDIFSFVEKFEGTDFFGSLKLLAERAGVVLDSRNEDKKDDKKNIYFEILEEATKFFEAGMEKMPEARSYLIGRGLNDSSIKSFRIGFVKDEWRSLSDYLKNKGYKIEDIETVGLIKRSTSGFYDRFRSRIMFPISDSSGRIIAFSGRIFGKDDKEEAKYLNSPDTPLFNKSNVLFGIDKAKSAIRTRGYSIVVEGPMDLIFSPPIGFPNTIAASGTAFTDVILDNQDKRNNLGLIRRLSPNIIFAYDDDSAGVRAANRSSVIALSLGMKVKIAFLPKGKDPADIIKENPKEWENIIRTSKDIINFHIDKIIESTSSDKNILNKRIIKVKEIIFPILLKMDSSSEIFSCLSEVSSKTGISSSSIIEDFKNYKNNNLSADNNKEIKDVSSKKEDELFSRRESLERRLLGIIFWQEDEDIGIDKETVVKKLEEGVGKEIFLSIKETHEPFRERLALEAQMWYGNRIKDIARDIDEIMLNLEEEILGERLILLLDKINKPEGEDTSPLLADYQKTVERIAKIKSHRSK